MKKQTILFLSLIVFFAELAFGQNDILTSLKWKLEHYNRTVPYERLYVHTDKNIYIAGEIVWFKIYELDTAHKRSLISKVAYVEILDERNSSVVKAKIGLDEKGGDGSIELPLTLNSGYYTFRAYTNWMKNFGPESFFEKKITIVNPLKSIGNSDKPVMHETVELFPEGGNLVNGIRSQVAFKITGADGNGTDGRGYLLNEKNDTLLRFSPYKFGLGSFDFIPDVNHAYKAIVIFNDTRITAKSLPLIYKEGYVMHAEEEDQKVKVTVQSNTVSDHPEMFLIVQNHSVIKAAKQNVLSNGTASFLIDESELGPGISQFTIFNSERQPVCERLFFIPPPNKNILETTASKEVYSNRDKVLLNIVSPSSSAANLSLSVYQLDSLQTEDASDITSYVWLESELAGEVENPGYYLSAPTNNVKKAADLLMLTQGWRRFDWEPGLSKRPDLHFLAENSDHTITCKVEDKKTGRPVNNVQVFLSIPETSYKLFSGESDDSGLVRIDAKDFYGKGKIILQTKFPDSYSVEVLNPFSEEYTPKSYASFAIKSDKKSLLEDHSIAMQVQHIYNGDSAETFSVPEIKDTFPFFGKAVDTYKLDSYTRFTTMEEVLREYVREINVGVKGSGNLKLKLLNDDLREFYTDNILVVVDGVPTFNTSKIFSIDPLKIKSLDIIPKSYILGSSFFYALASFSSYNGNYEGFDLDPKAIELNYDGLQIKREFYSPDYSAELKKNSRIPDFRTTLYWAPFLNSNQPVQFYTGDHKGRYLIVVQGMTNNGEPLSSTSEIEVK